MIRPYRDPIFLREMYAEKGLSPAQIADLSFSSKKTIMKYLIKYDIPLQAEDQPSQSKGTFGTKSINGRVLVNQEEVAVIERMKRLRQEGYSYRQITNIINTLGISPKHGKHWHLPVVYKVLKRNQSKQRR